MNMRQLPESETYEEGLLFWPYKDSLAGVLKRVVKFAPKNGTLLDIMCGPGYLLGEIVKQRPDLTLTGMDIDERYIQYGKEKYPGVQFEKGDVLNWRPEAAYDVAICTGSVHHVSYEKQDAAIANIASLVKPGGVVIISDCFVDTYSNEQERKLAAAKLGYEYLRATIENQASDRVIDWTVDILWNDVFRQEFKASLKDRLPIYEKYFEVIETAKVWPLESSEYGDYISVLKPR